MSGSPAPQLWGLNGGGWSSAPCLHDPLSSLSPLPAGFPSDQRNGDKEFVIRRAATNRVLNVLRHWVSKHSQVGAGRQEWGRGRGEGRGGKQPHTP